MTSKFFLADVVRCRGKCVLRLLLGDRWSDVASSEIPHFTSLCPWVVNRLSRNAPFIERKLLRKTL